MSFLSSFTSWLGQESAVAQTHTVSDWFASPPVLETERLRLRRARLRDAADIYAYASDPEVSKYVLWDTHRHLSDTRAYIRYLKSQYRDGLPSSFVIERKADERVIGTIGFMSYDADNLLVEVGYSLAREAWNRGYMSEALAEVIRYAFETLRIHRVEAFHDAENPASGRVMEKCGMHREGVLRGRVWNKGSYRDVVLYARTREDDLPGA